MTQINYYALVAGLPDILPEDKKIHSSSVQMRTTLSEELHPSDFELVKLFYLPYDHTNILNILYKKDKPFDPRGNFELELLEKLQDKKSYELADTEDLPDYLMLFLERFHSEEKINYFEAEYILTTYHYQYLEESNNTFVKNIAEYQLNIANLMVALNGRKFELAFDGSLVGENDVVDALKKSRTRDFGLSSLITNIEDYIQVFENNNLLERELKIDMFKWEYMDELTFFNYFSIERILSFIIKLFIVERWLSLDNEKGKEMFNALLKEIKSGFQFPEEFTIAHGKKK